MARLCLNMIVRNESARIERCLESLVHHISCAVIVDTGSTDDTPEKVKAFFDKHGVPVTLGFCLFDNFSQARNWALDLARDAITAYEADYILLCDADMELKSASPTWRNMLTEPAYTIPQRAGSLFYHNTRLLRSDQTARYIGATHEYLDINASPLPDNASVWFVDHADGANRGEKIERDIRLLTNDLRENPDNARSWFYLAQTYREAGRFDEARGAYAKRVSLGGWDEEVWYAQRMVGECDRKLSYEAGFIEETLAAYQLRPQRLEPLYDLAKFFREKGDNALAVLFADAGRGKPKPDDLLFLDEHVYAAGLQEEFSIAGFYLPTRRKEAGEVCNWLATDKNVPDYSRQLARANLLHYVRPLKEQAPSFKAFQIPFIPPEGYVPMNPSVTRHGEQMWVNVRCVNYTITPEGYYAIRGEDGSITNDNPIHTRNYLLRLSYELVPELAKEIDTPSQDAYPLVRGWEDVRLYSEHGELACSANVREANKDGWCEQHRGRIVDHAHGFKVMNSRYMPPAGQPRNHEKNWMPMPGGGFMYKVGHVVDRNGVTVTVTDPPFHTADLRGGSQLILFRGGYLALVHEAHIFDGKRVYSHRFVFFDAEGRPMYLSMPFFFQDRQIEFAAGLCWHPDGRRLIMSYGVRDHEAWLATVDATEVAEMVGLPG